MVDELELGSEGSPESTFEIDDTEGELVIKDSNDNEVARRDESAGTWVLDSVSTDQATITQAIGFSQSAIDPANTAEHTGNVVAVAGKAFHTIFDVETSVTVLWGMIYGNNPTAIRVTYGDGTTDSITSDVNALADPGDGTYITSLPVPSIRDVTKLEFKNGAGGSRDYGYRVIER